MFYLVEGYRQRQGRKLAEEPVRTSVVTVQQLTTTIVGILKEADVVQISPTSEEVFAAFYQERRRKQASNE